MDIEPEIKKQYSKIFKHSDWRSFKLMSDYYFETASKILKKNIKIDAIYQLMGRNIQKRLFLGIGTELLLKSLFLKNDYCINRVNKNKKPKIHKPTLFTEIPNTEILNKSDTFTLNKLIENISDVISTGNIDRLKKGLNIAKVYRNKEGHVVTLWHTAVRQNYTDIENTIKEIYLIGFNENLDFKISFLDNEKAVFKLKKTI